MDMNNKRFRQYRIVKTPKPFLRVGYKCFYIKITGIEGKRRSINLGTADKKEARLRAKREVDLLNSQLNGSFAKIVTTLEMIEAYFQSKTNLADSTRLRNKQHISFFLTFMNTRHAQVKYFSHINQSHIEGFQEYRINETGHNGKKLSPKTVKESLGVLNNMFEWAMKRGYVHSNPVRKIEKIKVLYRDQHVFSDEEIILILDYCKNSKNLKHLYPSYLIFATTGLRSGELSNLVWDDIDFELFVLFY